MRTHGKLVSKTTVTANEIEQILSLRRVYDAQKKRLEIAENALLEAEQSIMYRIQSGASVVSPHEVQIKILERRNVAWKGLVCELLGSERTEEILKQTPPSISYRLLIKTEAA